MRKLLIALPLLFGSIPAVHAQVSLGISAPGISIGINMPVYPRLVRVPGYPVYYAPQFGGNYFFYDGLYWVFANDNWYESSWYNGPWGLVQPDFVPLYIWRIPVRYYHRPPSYFGGWRPDAPPRWGEHWGPAWNQRHGGWDRWNRRAVPAPAPLPVYQRQYSGTRYPTSVEQQHTIQSRSYTYQPHDAVAQQHFQRPAGALTAAPQRSFAEQPAPNRPARPQLGGQQAPSQPQFQQAQPVHPQRPAQQPPQAMQPQPPAAQQHQQRAPQQGAPLPPAAQPRGAQQPAPQEKGREAAPHGKERRDEERGQEKRP
jgi:hypothetical protein